MATVDGFGEVTAHAAGSVRITAEVEGVQSSVSHDVAPFPATSLRLEGGREGARTGDVVVFRAVAVDDAGRPVEDLPVTWTHTVRARDFEHHASSAGGQIEGREIAVFKPADPDGYVPNSPMVWSAMPHKGWIFFSDTNSGLWSIRLVEPEVPVS